MTRKSRKNYLPTFIINIIFWVAFAAFIFKTGPEGKNIYLFFVFLTIPLSLTLALLLSSTRRGLLGALFICSLLIFRIIKQESLLNIFLSAAFFIVVELFFNSKRIDKNKFK